MTPYQKGAEWFVPYILSGEELTAGPFKSNGDAWRWIDRYSGQPISRAEKTAEWIFEQSAGGSGL